MGANKELFLTLRAEEIEYMYDSSFSKKEAIATGKTMVANLLEAGEQNPMRVWANICRLKEVVNSIDSEFRNKIELISKENVLGVGFNNVNGGETLNFKDDPIWSGIKKELTEREELLKTAYKSKKEIYDSEGIEVTKVSSTPRKSSVTIKF